MTSQSYEPSLARLLEHEGGYTNHPADPGGPTNFGITIYDAQKYAAQFGWIVIRKVTIDDMKAMPWWFAAKVYRAKYWDAMRCDTLEAGVDYAIFDYGVNSGIGRSGRVLRRLVGLPDSTSEITPEVIAAANVMPAAELAAAICDERLRFLESLRTWPVFGKGWGRRVAEVKDYALQIAQDLPLVADAPQLAPAQGKGIDPDAHARVRALQQHLADAGFDPGAIDGDLGPRTVKAFQRSRGLRVDGVVGDKTRPLLDAALAGVKPFVTV